MMLQDSIVIGLASISVWRFIISDRITQWPRHRLFDRLASAGGWLPYHIQYALGCAACLPLWLAFAGAWMLGYRWAELLIVGFAARVVGFTLVTVTKTAHRDLGDGVDFPPTRY